MIIPSILPPDRVYGEGPIVLEQLHPFCELQTLVIEEPPDGDSRIIGDAG